MPFGVAEMTGTNSNVARDVLCGVPFGEGATVARDRRAEDRRAAEERQQ